jgi:hypothetical protein
VVIGDYENEDEADFEPPESFIVDPKPGQFMLVKKDAIKSLTPEVRSTSLVCARVCVFDW